MPWAQRTTSDEMIALTSDDDDDDLAHLHIAGT